MQNKNLTFEEHTNEPADQEKIEHELRDMGGGFVERALGNSESSSAPKIDNREETMDHIRQEFSGSSSHDIPPVPDFDNQEEAKSYLRKEFPQAPDFVITSVAEFLLNRPES